MEDEIYKKCVSTEDIYDILDGEASKELCDLFTEHIKTCEKCRQEYENIKRLETALRDCTSEPSPDFAKNTLARLKTVKRNPFIRITGHPAFKSATAAVACLILVFAVCSKGVFGTAEEILDRQNYDEDIALTSIDGVNDETENSQFDAALYTAKSDEENNTDAANETDEISDALEKDIVDRVAPEEPQTNGTLTDETSDNSVNYYVVDEPTVEAEIEESNVGEFVPPMAPSPAPTDNVEYETRTTSGTTSSEVKSEVVAVPNAATSDGGPGGDVAVDNPSSSDAGGNITVETPMASDANGNIIENPVASDAFSNNPEIPEYIYFPTELIDNVTITEAIYDHDTTIISTENGIYFSVYENDVAKSELEYIQEECIDRSAEYADIIKEQQENSVPVEVSPGDPIPVTPMLPEDYGKPTFKELKNGLYIKIIEEHDVSCIIYWFENEILYKLLLPIEYIDGNEIRFTELTLIENPAK